MNPRGQGWKLCRKNGLSYKFLCNYKWNSTDKYSWFNLISTPVFKSCVRIFKVYTLYLNREESEATIFTAQDYIKKQRSGIKIFMIFTPFSSHTTLKPKLWLLSPLCPDFIFKISLPVLARFVSFALFHFLRLFTSASGELVNYSIAAQCL